MSLSMEHTGLDASTCEFYRCAMLALRDAEVPYLVGGAYALAEYSGVVRRTKDLDLFLRPQHCARALETLADQGFPTELTDAVWLGKVFSPSGDFVDVIFRSGNALCEVDDLWFEHAHAASCLGVPALYPPAEEMIWSKAFIMERCRYDGADVAHYLLTTGDRLDWHRLLWRFGEHWRVLLSHLVQFGFIYPGRRHLVPAWVLEELVGRLLAEQAAPAPEDTHHLCQGTLLSRSHYLIDVGPWGFEDARFLGHATLDEQDLEAWRAQAEADKPELLRTAGLVLEPRR